MVDSGAGILAYTTAELRVGHHQRTIPEPGLRQRLAERHKTFCKFFQQPFMMAKLIGMSVETAMRDLDHSHRDLRHKQLCRPFSFP